MKDIIFNKEISFIIDNVYCKYYLFDTSKPLVICFAGVNGSINENMIKKNVSPWGYDFIKKEELNIISFAPINHSNWYRNVILEEFLIKLAKDISIFKIILGYGNSMGGYGVSAYANILNIQRVLIYSPISTLKKSLVPFEVRYKINEKKDWENYSLDGSQMNALGYIVYDPLFRLDRKHAERYKNLIHLTIPGVGHSVPTSLLNMGLLGYIFRGFVNETLNKVDLKYKLRDRRKLQIYYSFMWSLTKNKNAPLRKKIIKIHRDKNIIDQNIIHKNKIDQIKDLALYMEDKDIKDAFMLMSLALKYRPDGSFIKKKYLEYKKRIDSTIAI